MRTLHILGNKNKRTWNKIFLLAWPVILTNLLHTLTVTVDMIMVGRLGPVAIASVGLGSQVVFISFAVMIAVSAGTIALVARHIGAKENKMANYVLQQSLILGAVLSIPLMLVGLFLSEDILILFGAEYDVVTTGAVYIQIIFLASVFTFTNFLSAAALRGAGDTKTPLYVGGIVSVVNIALNYILIFGKFGFPALGVKGAAIGTALSFVVGAVVYIIIFLKGKTVLNLFSNGRVFELETIKRIMKIGTPAATEQIVIQIGFIIYVMIVIIFGTNALAAHQIGMRIQSLSFMPGFGFAMAAAALVGQNLGAKKIKEAEQSGWQSMQLCVVTMVAVSALLFIIARPVACIFVDDAETVSLSVIWIRILAVGIPAIGIYFTIAGALRGAGDTKWPLYASVIGVYGCRLPLALLLGFYAGWGLYGVWIAITVEYYIRSILIVYRFKSGKWKHIKV